MALVSPQMATAEEEGSAEADAGAEKKTATTAESTVKPASIGSPFSTEWRHRYEMWTASMFKLDL